MRGVIVGAVFLVALGGCQKTVAEMSYQEIKQLASEIGRRCEAAGAGLQSPEYKTCFDIEARREIVGREDARQRMIAARDALADGLANAGRDIANRPTYTPRQQVTCRSTTGVDGSITTRCD